MPRQPGQYTLRVDGRPIIISLATARARCPAEVAAMEDAFDQVKEARIHGDQQAIEAAERLHQDRMRDLAHALGIRGLE